jgi:preprotein translocase subunit SecB|uniref:Preprotein translocase subunit SecB n=1 Tax=Siphoviridae sp. ct8Hx23 TaxID=2825360 RepID=A0A8S5P8E8_9CAUD|nr:MAG TPA: Preprotein translocase subunit SecB [Siphoviridae sp. ct8Hx23]
MKIALKQCYLSGVKCNIKPNNQEENIKISLHINSKVEQVGAIVNASINTEFFIDEKTTFLNVTYTGIYVLDKNVVVDKDELTYECTSLLFPYVREFVADITRRMPFQRPIDLNPALGNAEVFKDFQKANSKGNESSEESANN